MEAMVRLLILGVCLTFVSANDINYLTQDQCLTQENLIQAIATIRAEFDQKLEDAKAVFKEEVESLTNAMNQDLQRTKTDLKEQQQINHKNNLEIAKLQDNIARLEEQRGRSVVSGNSEVELAEETDNEERKTKVQRTQDISDISRKKEKHMQFKRQIATAAVAFSVALKDHSIGQNLNYHQIIHFDDILSNLGNAFDVRLGAFTAPTSGWYVFSLTLMSERTETQELEVVNGGTRLFLCYSEGNAFDSVSRTMVVHLSKGNEVWVRTATASFSHNVHGGGHTSFTGWLLYSD